MKSSQTVYLNGEKAQTTEYSNNDSANQDKFSTKQLQQNEALFKQKNKQSVVFLNEPQVVQDNPADSSEDLLNDVFAGAETVEANYFGNPVPSCRVYTSDQVFKYNLLFWALAFTIGMNYTHADVGFMQRFTLDPQVMKTWGLKMWAFFFSLVIILAWFLHNLAIDYIQVQVLQRYVVWAGILIGFIKWNTARQKENGRVLHVHHYFLALCIMTFISAQSPIFTVMHGFFHGMFIEGGCRWGFDPVWVPENCDLDKRYKTKQDSILLNVKQAQIRKQNYEQRSEVTQKSVNTLEYPAMQDYGFCIESQPQDGVKVIPTHKHIQQKELQLPNELLALLSPPHK